MEGILETTPMSHQELVEEVTELAFIDGASNPKYLATQILKTISKSKPEKKEVHDLENPSWDEMRKQASDLGYNVAIDDFKQLLGGDSK